MTPGRRNHQKRGQASFAAAKPQKDAAIALSARQKLSAVADSKRDTGGTTLEHVAQYARSHLMEPWAPSTYTAFKALLSARFCAAIWSNISDCDETFNYWEPTHFLLFKSGFQTWEYSPVYAIRSYAYILLHAAPGWVYSRILQSNKILVFYFLRCLLGFCCAACEAYFYRAVSIQFGRRVARLLLVFLLFSAGMFVSSTAFLPTSFSMYFTMLSIAAWLTKLYPVAIICTATSTFIGWPFAAVLGLPIVYDLLFLARRWSYFMKWCIISTIAILVPAIQLDSHFFGKLVIAPLNIVLYNVFSAHGPDIYGVEPWTFYFLNGFLNFNFVFIMAIISAPALIAGKYLLKSNKKYISTFLIMSAAMYVWMLIFFTRPHKEERFLFPIYPLFCVCGAITVDFFERVFLTMVRMSRGSDNWLSLSFAIITAILSVSRILAVYQGYHAPFEVYMEAHHVALDMPNRNINLCVGKEWYRFPSTFFLPENWQLKFIQSEFRGQLPKPYGIFPNATSVIPDKMNDLNLEEPTRYINVSQCDYLIDFDSAFETSREPRYSQRRDYWEKVFSTPFLDAARSHKLWRAFYVPWFSNIHCTYADYNLLKSTKLKS